MRMGLNLFLKGNQQRTLQVLCQITAWGYTIERSNPVEETDACRTPLWNCIGRYVQQALNEKVRWSAVEFDPLDRPFPETNK